MQLDAINDAFVEARDEIEYAVEVCSAQPTHIPACKRFHISKSKPQLLYMQRGSDVLA